MAHLGGELLASGEIKHRTTQEGCFAYERRDNWFWWQVVPHAFPIVEEGPRPYEPAGSGAPVTVWNDWPERLSNASIFPYLLPHEEGASYQGLADFVKAWYQTSCAVVYSPPGGGTCKIIGSGNLISDTFVSTARHTFQDAPQERLYLRFYHYEVEAREHGWLLVRERWLDVPIICKHVAAGGLDAGYLEFPPLLGRAVFDEYAKILPVRRDLFDGPLPGGHYAMFHFAGGRHPQISIGEIRAPARGMALKDDIAVQAGPGASGAAVLWQGMREVLGGGISIHRLRVDDWIDRRLIAFSQFDRPGWRRDRISAPYYFDPDFYLLTSAALNESGYEFISWRAWSGDYVPGRDRPDHPGDPAYALADAGRQSNHHIVPIADLLYLWKYLNTLDGPTCIRLRDDVDHEFIPVQRARTRALQDEISRFYPHDRTVRWNEGLRQIEAAIAEGKRAALNLKVQAELMGRYGRFYLIFRELFPRFPEGYRPSIISHDNYRTQFAWPWWNLFKGWKGVYRLDDPAGHVDDSEKNKPLSFNAGIWSSLKDDGTGLFRQLRNLRSLSSAAAAEAPVVEARILDSFTRLATVWRDLPERDRRIHGYNPDEWQKMGEKDGHDVYEVKKR